MSHWESAGKSDEWWTPKYVFSALDCKFDQDVAAPFDGANNVPCHGWFYTRSLEISWDGFIWMNPPFGGRNGIVPWLDKFFRHGNGIALTPDRTSATWWQDAAHKSDAVLFIHGKVKFERPDGTIGKQPSNGTTLFAIGKRGVEALKRANAHDLGVLLS